MLSIKYITTANILPHPDNPRKELGDLTELADSIKANGIFQNLTVVPLIGENTQRPLEGMYRCIIGHRRLAASKLAGVKDVPCIVANMDHKEQLATMLLENMQRSDLTVYEQAQGFQMMLNLGETVESLSTKTGFSETTVRRRVGLLKYDDTKLMAAQARGARLEDFEKLNEIKDQNTRDKVLDSIGTDNFKIELKRAIDQEKCKANAPLIKAELKSFAVEIEPDKVGRYEYFKHVSFLGWMAGSLIPADAEKYYFTWAKSGDYATLYKQKAKGKVDRRPQDEIDREKAVHARESALEELTERAYSLRREFVTTISVRKQQIPDILEYVCKAELYAGTNYCGFNNDAFREAMGITEVARYSPDTVAKYHAAYDESPLKAAALCAWCVLDDKKDNGYWHKEYGGQKMPRHEKNAKLDLIYEYLVRLGYVMSDEEKALRDGTHELFTQEVAA